MKENMVRLSFDIPEHEHVLLKTACAQSRLSMKEFMHTMMLKGLEELKERQLQDRLRKSVQQAKEGKVSSLGSFAKYAKNEI